jgi:putative phosphoesterase
MRIAALYDIHGNLPALEAVVRDVRGQGVDQIVIGGDVLPGPLPCEALDYLFDLDIPMRFISGNGDRMVLEHMAGKIDGIPEQARAWVGWTAQQLGTEYQKVVASWLPTLRLEIDGLGEVLFCHATPRNDTEIFTRLTAEEKLRPVFDGANADIVVCGHTHMQFDRMVGRIRVINAGSVGMPFGEPGAYWLLLGPDVSLRCTAYDIGAAADWIAESGFPGGDKYADVYIRRPPAENLMLEMYGKAELK